MAAAKKVESETPKGYLVVVSPTGSETTVPASIKDVLLDSGYTVK